MYPANSSGYLVHGQREGEKKRVSCAASKLAPRLASSNTMPQRDDRTGTTANDDCHVVGDFPFVSSPPAKQIASNVDYKM